MVYVVVNLGRLNRTVDMRVTIHKLWKRTYKWRHRLSIMTIHLWLFIKIDTKQIMMDFRCFDGMFERDRDTFIVMTWVNVSGWKTEGKADDSDFVCSKFLSYNITDEEEEEPDLAAFLQRFFFHLSIYTVNFKMI